MMAKVKQNPKKELICQIGCPKCKEPLDIFKITDVKKETVRGEKEVSYKVETSNQTTLG
jgi:hypothetical protein